MKAPREIEVHVEKQKTVVVCLLLILITAAAYLPVLQAGFINYDDMDYVFQNLPVQRGLTPQSVAWAFTGVRSANWHPLTWLSHMLDCQLFGLKAQWHHVTNLLFHIANTALVFLVFKRLTTAFWRSAFVAALFGLHPLHVESVAWISERKDVLSTFFFLLTLWSYAAYAQSKKCGEQGEARRTQQLDRSKRSIFYLLSSIFYSLALVSFALGLMSKPMLVTVPFLLLLLDYWPLQRFSIGTNSGSEAQHQQPIWPLVWEKAPFFALSAASSIVTFVIQKAAGAVSEQLPLSQRLANCFVSYGRYLLKTIWPANLALFYPHPGSWPAWEVILAIGVLLVITIVVLALALNRRYLPVGWFWFAGTLVPVIGLVQVGSQSMADRYMYIPAIGLFIIVAWAGASLVEHFKTPRMATGAIISLILLVCGLLTHVQAGYWKNSETLFSHALSIDEHNYLAHFSLGNALIDTGHPEEGRAHLLRATELNPAFPLTYGALAVLAGNEGKFTEAIEYYNQALLVNPKSAEALNNLAWLLSTCPAPAIRNGPQAVQYALQACQLTGFQKTVYIGTLAAAYAESGQFPEAISTAEKALQVGQVWGEDDLVRKNKELLELYRAGKAFHENQ